MAMSLPLGVPALAMFSVSHMATLIKDVGLLACMKA